ncbi:DUF803-domain-containing protein [Russula earlei]|uniref:DUF803-domain-containing protein n=1 Tax=Russula earlei TaxID=71964 RepID=A0ACC0U0R4_9AGAM|nr:DUF803-domain-containing protein [Russula earlei]
MPLTPLHIPMRHSQGIGNIEFPYVSRAMVIGITMAIAGNVLVSLALNLQKLAHARLDAAGAEGGNGIETASQEDGTHPGDETLGLAGQRELSLPPEVEREALVWNGSSSQISLPLGLETDPLVALPVTASADPLQVLTYGALFPSTEGFHVGGLDSSPLRLPPKNAKQPSVALTVEFTNRPAHDTSHTESQESQYLKSKLWWLGFLLMNVGETGNFISYAFAPASVVAPLGTFALIANCLFAPLLLHEQLRKRDLFGIVLAIIGAITVVLSSNPSDTRLSPEKLLEAISQNAFLIFSAIYVASASILVGFSEGSIGRRWVLVDVGLCALFGGFTVLSTKAVSTLLTTNGFTMFKLGVTYPILGVSNWNYHASTNLATSAQVLIGTGIGQIRYLNRALMRFQSKVVIPTQFVLFNVSAIIGSAILYGDFRTAKFHQFVTFMYGCAATFTGVWIIAWVPSSKEADRAGMVRDTEAEGHGLFITDDGPVRIEVAQKSVSVPDLESRRSTVSLVGVSPAQRVILMHTPPRPEVHLGPDRGVAWEVEHPSDGSIGRRRGITWWADDSPTPRLGSRIRERGSVERRWMTDGLQQNVMTPFF